MDGQQLAETLEHPVEAARQVEEEYSGDADRPLGTYLAAMSVYGTFVAGLATAVKVRGVRLPRRVEPWDLALIAMATQKLSRLVSKDPVTSPLRAPFTRFKGQAGPAELSEEARHEPVRHGVGELLTCPFCVSQWVATAFVGGLALAPRATRLAATTFAVVGISDLLQFAYAAAEKTEG